MLIAVRAVNQLVQAEVRPHFGRFLKEMFQFIREEATKMERMGKFLETALDRLPYVDAALLDSVLNQLVQCYGQVAKSGTAVAAEITKSQIQRMADLLKETDSLWSTLALRMLSELAKMTPALFYRYIENILSDLRRFIFHEQTSIRNDALETLKVRIPFFLKKNVLEELFKHGGSKSGWEKARTLSRDCKRTHRRNFRRLRSKTTSCFGRFACGRSTIFREFVNALSNPQSNHHVPFTSFRIHHCRRSDPLVARTGSDLPSKFCSFLDGVMYGVSLSSPSKENVCSPFCNLLIGLF